MPIRNRLISLLYRVVAFAVSVFTLVSLFAEGPGWSTLCFFGAEVNLVICIFLGFVIVFNLIDLIKHGVSGMPAGPNMAFSLSLCTMAVLTSIVYFSVIGPRDGFVFSLSSILSRIVMPVLLLTEWILFEEKGTVHWWDPFYWLIYPIFYGTFMLLRPIIWTNAWLINGSIYPYYFLNYSALGGGVTTGWCFGILGICFVIGESIIFFNNLLAGRFRHPNND